MFIVSRASQDNEYIVWETLPSGMKKVKKSVIIKGGANVIDKVTMQTPNGVVTEITEEQYKTLQECPAFVKHLENGFLEVMKAEKEAKETAKKKGKKDGGAQLTPKDFEERGQKAPVVNKN